MTSMLVLLPLLLTQSQVLLAARLNTGGLVAAGVSRRNPPTFSDEMQGLKCLGGHFSYPKADSRELQEWIEAEVQHWIEEVQENTTMRPEGNAAQEILEQIGTPLGVIRNYMPAIKGDVFRWASFTLGAGNELTMQAVALVEQKEGDVTVHGIVSRRSLLNDAAAVSGGGKALLASLLEVMHQQNPTRTIALKGSPGDSFVDKLYRKHGMVQTGETPDGYAKLQMNITASCVDFMTDAVLCNSGSFFNYAAVAWRLVPGSENVKETCAHTIPAETYWDNINKMLGRD